MFKRLLQSRSKLPITVEDMQSFIDIFLNEFDLPKDELHIQLVGQAIQIADQSDNTVDRPAMARAIKKGLANQAAFFVMYPKQYEQHLKNKAELEQEKAQESLKLVEQETAKP